MFNRDLASQIEGLESILLRSETLRTVLAHAVDMGLPDWYLGAGAVAQTVWNYFHDFPLDRGIADFDLGYYDADITDESDEQVTKEGQRRFGGLSTAVEITNQARVHLWYKEAFGKRIRPYASCEDAINTWPTTATALGIRYDEQTRLTVYAPYGLNDLSGMIVRPNKTLVTRAVYEAKAQRWKRVWPMLTVLPWGR